MKKCIVCQNLFERLSEEHIIPNAIGGKLTSKNLTCAECNRIFSDNFENAFIEKYRIFMYAAGLEQERGKGKPLNLTTINKEKIRYYPNKMVFDQHEIKKEEYVSGVKYQIKASSIKEAKQRISELIKQYPQYENQLQEQKSNILSQDVYLNDPICFNLQFNEIDQKSIYKIILLYLFYKHPKIKLSTNEPFKKIEDAEICKHVFLAFPKNGTLVSNIENNIYHLLVLKSFPDRKLLVGYVELFGFISAAVVIDSNYQGNSIEEVYLYDLTNKKELSKDYVLLEDIRTINFSNPPYDDELMEKLKERLGCTMENILKIDREREISRLVDAYFKNPQNIKPGEIITEKQMSEFINTLMPFFINQISER